MRKSVSLKLLSQPQNNYKLSKNIKLDVYTFSLALAHSDISGYNVCPLAQRLNKPNNDKLSSCSSVCVGYNGMAQRYPKVMESRIRKTKMYFENRELFMRWLISDIEKAIDFSIEHGKLPSFRINAYSDIKWENVPVTYNNIKYDNVFDIFPDVIFYDYTKHPERKTPANYHLTYSFWGNMKDSGKAYASGQNIAVVFEEMPKDLKYGGRSIVNGDDTDLRTPENDGKRVIVGLKFKGSKKEALNGIEEGFVVPRA